VKRHIAGQCTAGRGYGDVAGGRASRDGGFDECVGHNRESRRSSVEGNAAGSGESLAENAAGRPTGLTSTLSNSTHPPTLYTVNAYNPLGEITSATYGLTGSGTTATAHTATFDKRGRLLTVYDAVVTGSPYSLTLTYANGNVSSANDSVNGNWSSFQYDDFNRLATSWCSANCPDGTSAEGYTYTYYEFGNRWTQTLYSGSGPGPQPSYNFDANNHLSGTDCTHGPTHFCYDSAGNLLYDGLGNSSYYDAEGREIVSGQSGGGGATYTYDGLGQRVQRILNTTTVYDYVFDNQGHENTKATGGFAASAWSNLYFGGMHVSTYANGSTYFGHGDHLGSSRTETDPTGNTNSSAETNLPFGEWTSNAFQSELGFTGDLLDNPDGDTFHTPNRQYNQTQGRWLTPDPAGLAAVNITNPQTWNRYAYVGNTPTSFTDPSGLVSMPNVGTYAETGGGSYNAWADSFLSLMLSSAAIECPYTNCNFISRNDLGTQGSDYLTLVAGVNGFVWVNSGGNGEELSSEGASEMGLSTPQNLSFPQLLDLVEATNMSDLSDKLVACVAWVETGYSGNTTNAAPGGAWGLMSVQPATATAVFNQYSDNPSFAGFTAQSLYAQQGNPAISIMTGSAYLQMLAFDVYHLGIPGALSGYRYGPSSHRRASTYTKRITKCAK
jgi:RHS repeat-associated protein